MSGELSKKYPTKHFIGIDSNQNFIDDAKKMHSDKTNLHLECAWPESFKLEKPANFMLCHHLLHWLSPKEFPAVFKNIAANLQEGGVLDISSSAKQEDSSLTKAILKTLAKPKWWRFLPASCWQVIKGQSALTLLTIEELKELSANAGLKVEKCEEVEECASFDSKDQFALWIQLSLTPWGIDSIMKTQEAQKEFVADVADLFCKQYNASSDKIEYRFKGLHLLAHKQ